MFSLDSLKSSYLEVAKDNVREYLTWEAKNENIKLNITDIAVKAG
jgi:hypothetical protein